jgi:hypothetical protein
MTRKDYELIAKAIKDARAQVPSNNASAHAVMDVLAINLSNALFNDNTRFNSDRFIKAAEGPGYPESVS